MSHFRPNPKASGDWKHAIQELAKIIDKNNPEGLQKLGLQSARRFVKNAADITPPADGKANVAAKRQGENAILADLLKLAVPTTVAGVSRAKAREVLDSAEDLIERHKRSLTHGRVNPRNGRKLFVEQADFNRVYKLLADRVGWLAAGLNAAAQKLGFNLPPWIKRHGTKFGSITVRITRTGIFIRIVQNVAYTDDVTGYEKKWDYAFKREVRTLQKMMAANLTKYEIRARRVLRKNR